MSSEYSSHKSSNVKQKHKRDLSASDSECVSSEDDKCTSSKHKYKENHKSSSTNDKSYKSDKNKKESRKNKYFSDESNSEEEREKYRSRKNKKSRNSESVDREERKKKDDYEKPKSRKENDHKKIKKLSRKEDDYSSSDESKNREHKRKLSPSPYERNHKSSRHSLQRNETSYRERDRNDKETRAQNNGKHSSDEHVFIKPHGFPERGHSSSRNHHTSNDSHSTFQAPYPKIDDARWSNDKFQEMKKSGFPSFDRARAFVSDNDPKDAVFMEKRRKERERIGLTGVPHMWGKSPTHLEK